MLISDFSAFSMRHSAPSETVVSKLPVNSPCSNSKAMTGLAPAVRAIATAVPRVLRRNRGKLEPPVFCLILYLLLVV